MLSKRDLSNLPDWPRLLSRDDAAAYPGVSTWRIDVWRREGFTSDYVTGTKRFDRHAIDAALADTSAPGRSIEEAIKMIGRRAKQRRQEREGRKRQ